MVCRVGYVFPNNTDQITYNAMRASYHTRMMEKIGLIKDDLFKKSEALNELYSSCLLEGQLNSC